MIVLCDRGLGRELPAQVRAEHPEVEAFGDRYALTMADEVILADLARRGGILLSDDRRLLDREAPARALAEHGIGCFVLVGRALTRARQAEILRRAWPHLCEIAESAERPFLCPIRATGLTTPAGEVRRWRAAAGPARPPRPARRALREPPAPYTLQPSLPGLDPPAGD